MKFYLSAGLALLAVVLAAGCGSGTSRNASESTATSAPAASTAPAKAPPPEEAHRGDWNALKRLAGPLAGELTIPHGPPPSRVVVKELKRGSGPTIQHDEPFRINYVSFEYGSGRVSQRVWGSYAPILIWNIDQIVDALIPGLRGAQAGSVRELIVPGPWAYGKPLVYLVKLVALE